MNLKFFEKKILNTDDKKKWHIIKIKKDQKKVSKQIIIIKPYINIISNILTILLLIKGRSLYIKSLKGCSTNEFLCINNLQLIKDGVKNCLNSTFYFIVTLFLIQMQICSFYIFIIVILIYIELVIKDHGDNFYSHGKLNLFAFFSITIIGEILILIMLLYKYLFKKKKYFISFLITLFFFIIILIIILKNKDNYYCKDWDKGLNNTYINNDKSIYPCKIKIPKKHCLMGVIGPFIDFSKILNIKCESRNSKEKKILIQTSNLKYKQNVKRIGYPITIGKEEEIHGKYTLYGETLYNFVKNNLVDMDDKNQLEKLEEFQKPEIIVDFSNSTFEKLKN